MKRWEEVEERLVMRSKEGEERWVKRGCKVRGK